MATEYDAALRPDVTASEALKAVDDALAGVQAWRASWNLGDLYCACGSGSECYLHGVLLPRASEAMAVLHVELLKGQRP